MQNFRNLNVRDKAHALTLDVYKSRSVGGDAWADESDAQVIQFQWR